MFCLTSRLFRSSLPVTRPFSTKSLKYSFPFKPYSLHGQNELMQRFLEVLKNNEIHQLKILAAWKKPTKQILKWSKNYPNQGINTVTIHWPLNKYGVPFIARELCYCNQLGVSFTIEGSGTKLDK